MSTRLEDYLDFTSAQDLRLKGHRVGIEDVILPYLEGYSAEEIAAGLPQVALEQIHGVVAYYLHNRRQVDEYLRGLAEWREARYAACLDNPSALRQRLHAFKQRLETEAVPA
jgi:uncharacterized protein (DUF433 family)